jgi:hypothetical protein
MKMKIFVLLSVCFVFCSCSSLSTGFVVAVDDSLALILPQYKDYVTKDTTLDAETIMLIRKSVDELKKMVEEERKRREN